MQRKKRERKLAKKQVRHSAHANKSFFSKRIKSRSDPSQVDSFIEKFSLESIFPRLEQRFKNSRFADKETGSTIRNLAGNLPLSASSVSSPLRIGTRPIKSNRGIQLKLDPVFTEVQQDACSMRTNIETSKADIGSRRLNSRAKTALENATWIKTPLFQSLVTRLKISPFIDGHSGFNLAPFKLIFFEQR